MRLDPIERPTGWLLRAGFAYARRQFGKVPSAFGVIYARAPKLAGVSLRIGRLLEKGLSIDYELVQLLMTQSSVANGCTFCADLHQAELVKKRIGLEKFRALADHRTSPVFSEPERAALAYVEEVTRTRSVCDETFRELQKHFDERQIVEITWVNAIGNFFNLMAVPLGIESDGLAEIALARAR